MTPEKLQAEILRIAGMVEVEREPAITALWHTCRDEIYEQPKGYLRQLVNAQVNVPKEAETQDALTRMQKEYFVLNVCPRCNPNQPVSADRLPA